MILRTIDAEGLRDVECVVKESGVWCLVYQGPDCRQTATLMKSPAGSDRWNPDVLRAAHKVIMGQPAHSRVRQLLCQVLSIQASWAVVDGL